MRLEETHQSTLTRVGLREFVIEITDDTTGVLLRGSRSVGHFPERSAQLHHVGDAESR
jgi:hypothetical protein